MKKLFFIIGLVAFISINLSGQSILRKKPRDLENLASYTGQEIFLLDRTDWPGGDFKMMTLSQVTNYILSQGGVSSVSSLNDLSDVIITNPTPGQVLKLVGSTWINSTDEIGEAGASDHKFKLTSTDPTADYFNNTIFMGNYLTYDTDGDEYTIEGNPATAAEISGMSTVYKIVNPSNLPLVRLSGAALNNNAQTLTYNGLSLYRYFNGNQIEWRIATDFHSLQEVNSSTVDPYLAYVAIDDDENSAKIGIIELSNLMQSINYEILVIPEWWNVGFYMVGESYDACTACIKRRNIRIFKDGTEITSTQASHFSSANVTGLTSVYFTRDYNLETAAYEINLRATSTAGTYSCNGSIIWKADIIYTDPSTGISSRVTVGMSNPYVTPCNGSNPTDGMAVPDSFTVVKMVDSWPTTTCEGLFFKLGSGLRYYYIEEGSCAWGFQDYSGNNGGCLQTK